MLDLSNLIVTILQSKQFSENEAGDLASRYQRVHETALHTGGRRGLAGASAKRRSEIASLGGRAAQEKGVAHKFTSTEAVAAGALGAAELRRVMGEDAYRKMLSERASNGGKKSHRGKANQAE